MCINIARDAKELYEQRKPIQEIRAFIENKYKHRFQHPVTLEGAHADLDCTACHSSAQSLTYRCADCHQPPENHPEGACDTCHTPEGWVESAASVVAQSSQIPHPLNERDGCLVCHNPAGNVEPAPADHKDFINEQCTLCRKLAP
jgi:hypothetical protein